VILPLRNTSGALLATIAQASWFSPWALSSPARADLFEQHGFPSHGLGHARIAPSRHPVGPRITLDSADLWVTLGPGELGHRPGRAGDGRQILLHLPPRCPIKRRRAGFAAIRPESAPVISIAASAHEKQHLARRDQLGRGYGSRGDLFHYWPPRLVPMTRGWVIQNITAGTAGDAHFTLAFRPAASGVAHGWTAQRAALPPTR